MPLPPLLCAVRKLKWPCGSQGTRPDTTFVIRGRQQFSGRVPIAPQWFAKAKRQANLAWNRGMSAKYDPLEDPKYSLNAVADDDDDDDDEDDE